MQATGFSPSAGLKAGRYEETKCAKGLRFQRPRVIFLILNS
jgi:hypothetical protein